MFASGGEEGQQGVGKRNTQGAQHGLSVDETACDKTEVSFGED